MLFGGCGEGGGCANAVGGLTAAVGDSALDFTQSFRGLRCCGRDHVVLLRRAYLPDRCCWALGCRHRGDRFGVAVAAGWGTALLVASHGAVEEEVLIVESVFALLVWDDGAWKIGLSIFVHTFCVEVGEILRRVVGRV